MTPRFLFILLGLFFFASVAVAKDSHTHSFLIDESQIVDPHTTQRVSKILSESARLRNVHVMVFVLNEKSQEPLEVLAKIKIQQWLMKHPMLRSKGKVAYLVMNAANKESWMALGDGVVRTTSLREGLLAIQKTIILPALATHDIQKAVLEGALALSVALDDWPVQQGRSGYQNALTWLASMHLLTLLKWLLVGLSFFGIWKGIERWSGRSYRDEKSLPTSPDAMLL